MNCVTPAKVSPGKVLCYTPVSPHAHGAIQLSRQERRLCLLSPLSTPVPTKGTPALLSETGVWVVGQALGSCTDPELRLHLVRSGPEVCKLLRLRLRTACRQGEAINGWAQGQLASSDDTSTHKTQRLTKDVTHSGCMLFLL